MPRSKTQVIPTWNMIGSTRPADIFKVGNPVKQTKQVIKRLVKRSAKSK